MKDAQKSEWKPEVWSVRATRRIRRDKMEEMWRIHHTFWKKKKTFQEWFCCREKVFEFWETAKAPVSAEPMSGSGSTWISLNNLTNEMENALKGKVCWAYWMFPGMNRSWHRRGRALGGEMHLISRFYLKRAPHTTRYTMSR